MIDIEFIEKSINGKATIIAEWDKADFIPRRGDLINFKNIKNNLKEWQKDVKFEVVSIEFVVPSRIIIEVYG